jgi:hypothetical protein
MAEDVIFETESEGGRYVQFIHYEDNVLGVRVIDYGLDMSIDTLDAIISEKDVYLLLAKLNRKY